MLQAILEVSTINWHGLIYDARYGGDTPWIWQGQYFIHKSEVSDMI